MLWWQVSWRRTWLIGGLELALLLGLSTVLVWLSWAIQEARRELAERERRAAQIFAHVGEASALAAELEAREAVLRDVALLVPAERDIGSVVALLEREAVKRRVTLRVPQVEEVKLDQEDGDRLPPAGPLRDVRLQLVVSGEAERVLSFFRQVEHLPYLLRVVQWELVRADSPAGGATGGSVPVQGPPLGEQREREAAAQLSVELTLEVNLSILQSEGDEAES